MKQKLASTILILDKPNLVTETTCKAVFPEMQKIYSSDDNLAQTLKESNFDRIILATKDSLATQHALECHEIRKKDIIPFEFVYTDPDKINPETLCKIIFFEFYRMQQSSIRSKANIVINLSFQNIYSTFEKENLSINDITEHTHIFYNLVQSIERNNALYFLKSLEELNSLPVEKQNRCIPNLVDFIEKSKTTETIAGLFFPFLKLLIDKDNFFPLQEPILQLIDAVVRILKKDIYKIYGFNFTSNVLFIAFDKNGTFPTIKFMNDIIGKTNIHSNQVFQNALSKLFNNEKYTMKSLSFDRKKSSLNDVCLEESCSTILKYSQNNENFSTREKISLTLVSSEYASFLVQKPTESEKKQFLASYSITV